MNAHPGSKTTEILDMGFTLQVDKAGYFVNPCCVDNIVPPWQAVVDDIVSLCRRHLGPQLMGVYVRGSVARGTAVPGVSDIDTFMVVEGNRWALDLSWVSGAQRDLDNRYPFQTGVEIQCVSDSEILNASVSESVRFTIKTLSACVYGRDIGEMLPKYKFGQYLAAEVHQFAASLRDVTAALSSGIDGPTTKAVCRWVMKCFVRTGFYLVMHWEGRYSRDLYPCFRAFCKYYPEHEAEMEKAFKLAIDPMEKAQALLPFVQAFGGWLGSEVDKRFVNSPPGSTGL